MTKQLLDGPSVDVNHQKATTSSKPKKPKAKKDSVGRNEDLAKSEHTSSSLSEIKDVSSAAEVNQSPVKTLSKKKSSKQQAEQTEEGHIVVDSSKKSKKRKNRETDPDLASRPKEDTTPEPPKKKHKNRTEFADPRLDTTLNAQSRKALEYAFLQMNRPSKWKFNKARQNWLIRNVWNSEAVSDTYFPFVLKYLVNVQGGSREKLKETCGTYLNPPEPAEVVMETTEAPAAAPKSILKSSLPTTTKKAGPLTDVTPVPGVLISLNSTSQLETPVDATPKLADIQRQRAQMLLDALGPVTDSKVEV